MFERKNIITAVEIGTSKICVLIGESDDEGNIGIIGHGEVPSDDAIFKGEICQIEDAISSLSEAFEQAESSIDREIDQDNLFVSITGSHINSQEGIGSIIISDEDRRIKEEHIKEAMRNAQNITLHNNDREIINTFDKYFLLDGDSSRRLANPLEQIAHKLDAYVHVISGVRNRIDNTKTLLREIGFDIDPLPVFSGIASAYGVLKPVDIENGALLVEMGAGTTEYILVHNSGIYHSGVITVGCDHIANDLAVGLDLSISVCRKLLREGKYVQHRESGHSFLEISSSLRGGSRKVPVNSIEKIIDMRLRETFNIVRNDLETNNLLSKIATGIVLSGGAALIPQSLDSLKSVFQAPVRVGKPDEVSGAVTELTSPRYSTTWGLLRYGDKIRQTRLENNGSIGGFINSLDRFSSKFLKKFSLLKESIKF